MPKNTVKFPPNVAIHQLALESTDGEQIAPDLYVYDLVDGRQMYIPTALAVELRRAEIRPGEQFSVCWRWDGDRATAGRWDVWLTGSAERRRAVEEAADPSDLEQTLARSLAAVEARKARDSRTAPRLSAPTPGTSSPAGTPRTERPTTMGSSGKTEGVSNSREEEPPHPALAVIPERPSRKPLEPTPADEALPQLIRMTGAALEASGERWSDASVQDLVSTVFIWAAGRGYIGRWKGQEAPARIA